ncbi:hypothetical protein [Catenulispora pinisilvae]|uniref:hypothetical protein n=1 Tax=Catenulispora pinisilvae TaxID=2705253 RepID=UPI001E5F6C3A|nr:hypothetical protein [Catenulispora pinisilvae]
MPDASMPGTAMPGAAMRGAGARLTFRPFADTEELLTLTSSALSGTLDVHSREDLTRMSAREAAIRDDILAEGTRILAEQDVPRIRASTDLDSVPMANAFRRAGYVTFECEIKMGWGG